MPAANSWLSTVRYQSWQLIPLSLGLGYGVHFLGCRKAPLGFALVIVFLMTLFATMRGGFDLSFERHPESAQLDVWRKGYEALPKNALVGIPTGEHGRFNLQYADVEMRSSRPDLELRALSQLKNRPDLLKDRPIFVFIPLQCRVDLASDAVPDKGKSSECDLWKSLGRWDEALVSEVRVATPREDLKGWWNLHPYSSATVTIGFYSLAR
jgi:hypothetical protein